MLTLPILYLLWRRAGSGALPATMQMPMRSVVRKALPDWLWALFSALIAALVAAGLLYFIDLPRF